MNQVFLEMFKKGGKTPCKEAKWFASDVLSPGADDKQDFLVTNVSKICGELQLGCYSLKHGQTRMLLWTRAHIYVQNMHAHTFIPGGWSQVAGEVLEIFISRWPQSGFMSNWEDVLLVLGCKVLQKKKKINQEIV